MAYIDQWHLLNNEDFRGRVTVAGLKAATDIVAEDPGHDHHYERQTLAAQVQAREAPAIDSLVLACAMNPTIAAAEAKTPGSCADTDLDYVVASSWDKLAGVTSS